MQDPFLGMRYLIEQRTEEADSYFRKWRLIKMKLEYFVFVNIGVFFLHDKNFSSCFFYMREGDLVF